jgi:DNA-binding transcriptional LysR family regulator
LFVRLPRGVKISSAGKLFLDDARRILQQVDDATARARPIGNAAVGLTENASWHGVVPDSFRQFRSRHPDAELQLNLLASLEQLEVVRSGRLDAGSIYNMAKGDWELDQVQVGSHSIALAVPEGHSLSKLKTLRLRDMINASFIWFPRRESPAFYDRLMNECFRGGLKSPRIVQEARNEATILSLVSHCKGVKFVPFRLNAHHWAGGLANNRIGIGAQSPQHPVGGRPADHYQVSLELRSGRANRLRNTVVVFDKDCPV